MTTDFLLITGKGDHTRRIAHAALDLIPSMVEREDELGHVLPEEPAVMLTTAPSVSKSSMKDYAWRIRARRSRGVLLNIEARVGTAPVPSGPVTERGVLVEETASGGIRKVVLWPGQAAYVPIKRFVFGLDGLSIQRGMLVRPVAGAS